MGQDAALVQLAMHVFAEQEKPVAQSAFDAQVVLQVEPEQAKLFAQFLGLGRIHLPAEHVPGSCSWLPEHVNEPQEPA